MGKSINTDTSWYFFVLIVGLCVCYGLLPGYKQPTFIFYALTLVLSMMCVAQSERTQGNNRSFLYWSGFFIFGFPMAFHTPEMSLDDIAYMYKFDMASQYTIGDIDKYFETFGIEKGYLLLTWVSNAIFNNDYELFQVFRTYLNFALWGYAIRLFTKDTGGGDLMMLFIWSHSYFFVLNSGLIRIFLAMPLVLIAMYYVWINNWRGFLISLFVASLVHMSSLIMLIYVPFFIKPNSLYKHWIVFVASAIFIVGVALVTMAQYIVPLMGDRYQGYGEVDELNLSLEMFMTLPILVTAYFIYKRTTFISEQDKRKFIIGLTLVSLAIVFSIVVSMVHVGRITFYSYMGFMILTPLIIRKPTDDTLESLLKLLWMLYPLVYVMGTTMMNTAKIKLFPYQPFISF